MTTGDDHRQSLGNDHRRDLSVDRTGQVAPRRPRDAASLILLDRQAGGMRVLVGRRSRGHVFMPDLYVFPGGRRDPLDHRVAFASDMHPSVLARLATGGGRVAGPSRHRALAIAAVRELYEETGIVAGRQHGAVTGPLPFLPDLAHLRYMARAITPPGYVRRFDTRFFAFFTDEAGIDPADIRASAELEDVHWVDLDDVSSVPMPDITLMIFDHIRQSVKADPALPFERQVPLYHTRHGRFVRDLL